MQAQQGSGLQRLKPDLVILASRPAVHISIVRPMHSIFGAGRRGNLTSAVAAFVGHLVCALEYSVLGKAPIPYFFLTGNLTSVSSSSGGVFSGSLR